MSSLSRVSSRAIHTTRILARGPLTFDGWYPRDHKPGPYPTTDAERRASAIKYGMRPEDYKAVDPSNVRLHAGDYPEVGAITYDHKDPYENYSDPHHRRNWGELVTMEMMRYRADRYTFTGLEAEDYQGWRPVILILRVIIPMAFIAWYFSDADPHHAVRWRSPVLAKQYPYDFYRAFPYEDPRSYPIVNYSFEPLD